MLNWESFSPSPKTNPSNELRAGEKMTLVGEKQIPVPAREINLPPPQSNDVTRFIDKLLAVLKNIGVSIRDVIFDRAQDLPLTPAQPQKVEPKIEYCYLIGNYLDSQNALADKELLSKQNIKTTIISKEKVVPNSSGVYRIEVRVRTSLDAAKEFADMLIVEGVPNTIKENPPLGYLLVSRVYKSRNKATAINEKIQSIGLSSYIKKVGSAKSAIRQNIYQLQIKGQFAAKWEEIRAFMLSSLSPNIKVKHLSSC